MRSLRALTWLLVLLVLVPAGVLGWLGYRSTAALDDAFDARVRADLTEARQEIEQAAAKESQLLERWLTGRLEALAEGLGRDAPIHGLPAAMATLRAGLPARVTVWNVRLLDTEGRTRWPVTRTIDEPVAARATDRLLDDLERQADRARFGRGDGDAALRVWRDAAEKTASDRLRAAALAEAALLEARLGRVDASAARRSLLDGFGAVEREAARRPLTLLLLHAASRKDRDAACALAEAWVGGELAEVPLTETEREAARRFLHNCREPVALQPAPPGVGNPHGTGYPVAPEVAVEGPGGSTLVATVDPDSLWSAMQEPLERRAWAPVGVHVWPHADTSHLDGAEADVSDDGFEWPATVLLDGPFGVRGRVIYSHEARLDAQENRVIRRRLTKVGVVSLLALMGVGLLLVRRAARRERDARQLRDDFIANVSHELRTPLTSVCLHAEMLAEEEDLPADRRRDLAHVVKAEGGRLAALVDDLLDFSALEQGVRRIEPEPVDLVRALRDAVAPYETLAAREGATLDLEVPDDELLALADAHALSRILANLLSNAWRHGRPSRDGAPGRIRIRAYDDARTEEGPTVEVRDDGPGIPADERGAVFERFHRGSGSERVEGTGLGLALGRDLALAMDGDLALESDPEATVFRLTLPAVPDLEP